MIIGQQHEIHHVGHVIVVTSHRITSNLQDTRLDQSENTLIDEMSYPGILSDYIISNGTFRSLSTE
jgi:hypothetical protein